METQYHKMPTLCTYDTTLDVAKPTDKSEHPAIMLSENNIYALEYKKYK
jgi:hypothetical protein